jgi:chromosome segregation ATPase
MEHTVENAYRDEISGAVIFDDEEGYRQARLRRKLAKEKRGLQETVESLEGEVREMKNQMAAIMRHLNV